MLLKSNWERRLIAATESATDQLTEADSQEETWVAPQALSVTQLSDMLLKSSGFLADAM